MHGQIGVSAGEWREGFCPSESGKMPAECAAGRHVFRPWRGEKSVGDTLVLNLSEYAGNAGLNNLKGKLARTYLRPAAPHPCTPGAVQREGKLGPHH